MNFIRTNLKDTIICEPKLFKDDRGYFCETFRSDLLENFVSYKINFCQDNESSSTYGVLRGLHFQVPPFAQSKLVRVTKGVVQDVAVDLRVGSQTFGKFTSVILSEENKRSFFIPRGFAHGFLVLSKEAIFNYKVDNYYSKDCDRGLAFDDFEIDWQISKQDIVLSPKDLQQPKLSEVKELFDIGVDYYA